MSTIDEHDESSRRRGRLRNLPGRLGKHNDAYFNYCIRRGKQIFSENNGHFYCERRVRYPASSEWITKLKVIE